MACAKASGDWSPNENKAPADSPKAQLYDRTIDSSEQSNQYLSKPEVASELFALQYEPEAQASGLTAQ